MTTATPKLPSFLVAVPCFILQFCFPLLEIRFQKCISLRFRDEESCDKGSPASKSSPFLLPHSQLCIRTGNERCLEIVFSAPTANRERGSPDPHSRSVVQTRASLGNQIETEIKFVLGFGSFLDFFPPRAVSSSANNAVESLRDEGVAEAAENADDGGKQ